MVNYRNDFFIFDAKKTSCTKTECNIVLYCNNFIDQAVKQNINIMHKILRCKNYTKLNFLFF